MSDFDFAIFDENKNIVGMVYCKAQFQKDTLSLVKEEWSNFLKWRKETKNLKFLTKKEKLIAGDNIPRAFTEFLYMQGNWSCGSRSEDIGALYM